MCVLHVGNRDFPARYFGEAIMNDQSNTTQHAPGKILKPRRLTLLASAAGLSMAILLVGPGGYRPFNLPAFTASAHAAEDGANPCRLRRPRRQGKARRHIGSRQDR